MRISFSFKMAISHLFHIIVILWIKKSLAEEFNDTDTYVTDNPTSFWDIPENCTLFGSGSSGEIPTPLSSMNIEEKGTFWIAAKLGLKNTIFPIGKLGDCTTGDHLKNTTLDKCRKECNTGKYFLYHKNNDICKCQTESDPTVQRVLNGSFMDAYKDRLTDACILYEKEQTEDNFKCGSYTFKGSKWWFKVLQCTDKPKISFECVNKNTTYLSNVTNVTWFEAVQHCRDNNSELVEGQKNMKDYKNEQNKTYWLSFYRNTTYFWGKEKRKNVCVAMEISEKKNVTLVSKFCRENLLAICHKQYKVTGVFNYVYMYIGLAAGCGCLIMIILITNALLRCRRTKLSKNIEHMIKKQLELDDKIATESAHAVLNQQNPSSRVSAYSLAGAYCEPWVSKFDNTVKPEDDTYDHASQEMKVCHEHDDTYDHVAENLYEDPVS